MRSLLDTPTRALAAGALVTLAILALWILLAGYDRLGMASFLLRWLHVFAGIVWVGLIWFVNFVQLALASEGDDQTRSVVLKQIAPRVAFAYRHASHLNVLTGILLMVTAGYLLDLTTFGTAVYVPPLRNLLLWGGTIGGVVMWALVHFVIWPGMRIVLGERNGDVEAARRRVHLCARLNLALSLPVTFVMVAAAHLY